MKQFPVTGSRADSNRPGGAASGQGAVAGRVRSRRRREGGTSLKVIRTLYTGLGLLCLGLGVVGAFVPLLPSTIFLIIAAWCFARGNARLYRRLQRHPLYAPVRAWKAGRGLSAAIKVTAVGSIILTFSLSIIFVVQPLLLKVLLAGLALGLSVYLLRQPTRSFS